MHASLRRFLVPDLLGIGAMRSGTTWMERRLRLHPQIWMSRRKEVHFFDRRMDRGRIRWLPVWEARLRYALFFIEGRLRGRRVTGEITPEYAVLPDERIALIRQWMPDVKILFLMRDPIDRAWSHARKNISEGRAIRKNATEDDILTFLQHPDVVARGDYVACIRRWQRHFPADQFLFLFLEEIETDPAAALDAVYRFLGVDTDHRLPTSLLERRENARADEGMTPRIRALLESQFESDTDELEALVGRAVPWDRARTR